MRKNGPSEATEQIRLTKQRDVPGVLMQVSLELKLTRLSSKTDVR
jgi:hypothetical protein